MVAAPPLFVAYVYPGWHDSPYRTAVDEWALLGDFEPYFDGHQPPPRPVDGEYDDSTPATALRQARLAKSFGIDAFTYFLYYLPDQFVLAAPIDAAFEVASRVPDFAVGLTWCLRLPHRELPIPRRAAGRGLRRPAWLRPEVARSGDDGEGSAVATASEPFSHLTLGELRRLLGPRALDGIAVADLVRLARSRDRA